LNKIIIYKTNAGNKYLLVLDNRGKLLFFFDIIKNNLLDSVFNLKVVNINYKNKTAFVSFDKQDYFVNFVDSNIQLGTNLLCQLVWNGNDEKQPKVKLGFNLIGKYVILNNTQIVKYSGRENTILNSYIKLHNIKGVVFRSLIDSTTNYDLVISELTELLQIRSQIIQDRLSKSGLLYLAPNIFIKFICEQASLENYLIMTNDRDSYQQILSYQKIWQIKHLQYVNDMDINIDDYVEMININTYSYNNLRITFNQVSGIHIIDIDSSNAKLSFYQTNLIALDLIVEKIILKDISGIILIDLIKNLTYEQKQNIILKIEQLFEYDFRKSKIFGFTATDMFELIRMK
jgi:ribonuclease G